MRSRVSLHDVGCTFLGVNCSQSWADFQLWENLLTAHPELRSIVELGTGEAGFSRFLHIQAEARGLEFATFDRVRMDRHRQPGFRKLDIFDKPGAVVSSFVHPVVLFCDNGDKPREVATFAPHLQPGDLLVVHDYGTEFWPRHIPDCMKRVHREWWRTSAILERT
jgi:hypothetical protein